MMLYMCTAVVEAALAMAFADDQAHGGILGRRPPERCHDGGVGRTERYVVGLLETLLGPGDRVRRFAWAHGDGVQKSIVD